MKSLASAVAIVFLLLGTGIGRADEPSHVDATEARALLASDGDVIVLDVRTPGEFEAVHIDRAGAMNIDVDGENFDQQIAGLDRDKTYVVHCAAGIPGGRSERATKALSELGFEDVRHLDGGINAWKEAGYEVEGTAVTETDDEHG